MIQSSLLLSEPFGLNDFVLVKDEKKERERKVVISFESVFFYE